MILKVLMTVVIVCLLTETLAESRDRGRSKKSQLTSQRLNRYLQPPPFQSANAQQPKQVTKLRSVSSSSSPPQREQGRSNTGDLDSRGHRNSRWFYETGESPRPTKLAPENKQHGTSVHSPSISQPHTIKSPQQSASSSHRYRSILPYRGGPQKTYLQGDINGKPKGDCNPCNKVPWIPMPHTSSGISDHFLALGTPHSGPSSYYRDLPVPNLSLQSAQYGPPLSTAGAPLDLDSSFSNSEVKGQSPPFKQLPNIGLQSDYGLHPKPSSSSLTVQHSQGGEQIYKHSQLNYGLPPLPPPPSSGVQYGHSSTSLGQNLPISINHEPHLSEPPKQSNKHYRPTPQSFTLKGLKSESYPPTSRFPQLAHIPTASYGIPVAPAFPSKHLAESFRPPKQQPIIFHSKAPDYLPPPPPPVIPALDSYKLPDSLPSGTDFRPPQSPQLALSELNNGSPPFSLSDNFYSHHHLSNEFGLPPPTQKAHANEVTSKTPDYNQYSTIIATHILSPSYTPVHPVHEAQVISHDSSVSHNHEQTKNYHQQQDSSLQQYLVPPLSSGENFVVNNQHQQSHSHFQQGNLHDEKNNIAGVDLRGFTGGVNFDVVQSVPLVETSFTSSDEQHSGEHFNSQSSKDGIHVIPAESEEETKHKNESDSPYSTDQLIQSSGDNHDQKDHNESPNIYSSLYNNDHSSIQNQQHTSSSEDTKNVTELELIKSVRLANYISSIEYPIQVIQSPYIDLTQNSSSLPSSNQYYNLQHTTIKPYEDSTQNIQQNNNANYDSSDFNWGGPIASETNKSASNFNSENISFNDGSYHKVKFEPLNKGNTYNNFQYANVSLTSHYDASNNIANYSEVSDQNYQQTNLNVVLPDHYNQATESEPILYNISNDTSFSQPWSNASVIGNYSIHENSNFFPGPSTEHILYGHNWISSNTQQQQYIGENGSHQNESEQNINVLNYNQENIAYPGPTHPPQYQVTVEVQPSLQTTAQIDSLIHQINDLRINQHPTTFDQIPNTFQKTHFQNSVYSPVRNVPIVSVNYPPQNYNQQIPPPTSLQDQFKSIQRPFPQAFNYIGVIQHPLSPSSSLATFQNTYFPEAPALYLNPPRKEHEVFNHVTNSPAIDYTSWNPASGSSPIPPIDIAESIPSWTETTTPLPLQHSVNDNHAIDSIENVGLLPPPPPPPPFNQQLSQSAKKKTKQIQIIVPYTSNREAMPFEQNHQTRPLNIETSGWSPMKGIISDTYLNHEWKVPYQRNCSYLSLENIKRATMCNSSFSLDQWLQQQEDYHQHQESRTVTATASVTQNPFQVTTAIDTKQNVPGYNIRKPSGEIQHVLTSNIRDILRGEEYGKHTVDYITLLRLQKNINDWTAQEYSSSNNSSSNKTSGNENKSTTPAFNILSHHLLVPSKNIPEEYLTTSPSVFDDFTQSENAVATSVPKYPIRSNLSMQTTPVFYDHEASGSFLHPVNKSSNQVVFQINNIEDTLNREKQTNTNKIDVTKPSPVWNDHRSNDISTVTDTISTTTLLPTTTEVSSDTTTFDTTIDGDLTSLPSWDELEVSISPITKEKVYVVTPLTTWAPDPTTSIPPRNHRLRGTLTNTPRTRTSSTSIHDVFPFRNGPKPSSGTKEDSEESFHSPRFSVRPTPSPTMQRSFTVTSADDDDTNFSKGTAPYPVEDNEISYTYSKGPFGSGVTSAANSSREKSTAETLLWGLTDLPTYTPPAGTRVRTYSGHSRVVTAPTIASSRKKLQGLDTKKQTAAKTSTTPSTTSSRPRPVGILRKYRPDRHSYLWHFPELLTPVGDTLKDDEEEAVKSAVVELKKESRS